MISSPNLVRIYRQYIYIEVYMKLISILLILSFFVLPVIAGQNITNVSYEVVDGGELDIDGLKNGAIVDPVGLGHLVVGVPRTGLGGTR
jgi:hypothetical protein